MALFTTPVDKTAAEVSKLRQAREKLEAEDLADRAKLAELRAGQGEIELGELLGNGKPLSKPKDSFPSPISDAVRVRYQIGEFEGRIQGRASARPKLMARIRESVKAHAHARAEVIRKEVAPLRAKYDAHMAETARLLGALEDHAGIRYEMRLAPDLPPGTAFLTAELRPIVPKFRLMEAEITKLLAEAEGIESQANRACECGQVLGASLTELLAAIGDNPLAPTRPEIEAWYSYAAARSVAEWKCGLGAPINGAPPPIESGNPFFTLAWGPDGLIDQHRSGFVNRENRVPGTRPFGPVLVPGKVA